jgi:hypothetical protein
MPGLDKNRQKALTGRILAIFAGDQIGRPKKNVGQGQLTPGLGLNGDADALNGKIFLLSEKDFLARKAINPDLSSGFLGENLLVSLDLDDFPKGQRLRSGDALIELIGVENGLRLGQVILGGIVTEGDQIYPE